MQKHMFDIKFNVNVKRKFKVNGVEYNSIEEMPENVRENFKKTMAAMAGSKQGINLAVSRTKISFNGAEYDGPDAMPPDARQLYEKALKAAETGDASPEIDLANLVRRVPGETKFEASFSPRVLIAVIAIAVALFLFYYFTQVK